VSKLTALNKKLDSDETSSLCRNAGDHVDNAVHLDNIKCMEYVQEHFPLIGPPHLDARP
jgi:hypothetical protein